MDNQKYGKENWSKCIWHVVWILQISILIKSKLFLIQDKCQLRIGMMKLPSTTSVYQPCLVLIQVSLYIENEKNWFFYLKNQVYRLGRQELWYTYKFMERWDELW